MVRRAWLGMIGAVFLLAALLLPAGPAAADLALVSTSPADGTTVSEPVAQVSLTFSAPGEPAGAGIVLLDQSGQPIPTELSSPDGGMTWLATPAVPLESGQYGVEWRVASRDTHAATGAFRFTVALPVVAEPGTAPPAEAAEEPGAEAGEEATAEAAEVSAALDGGGSALDEALAQPRDTTSAEAVRWVGTTMMLAAALFGVGGLVFLALVMAGRRSEVRWAFALVRGSAVVLIAGSLIQVAGRSTMRQDGDWAAGLSPSAIGDLLGSGSYGLAVGLRVLGGLLILFGLRAAYASAPRAALGAAPQEQEDPVVTAAVRRSPLAILGAGLYLVSFLFDGHTVTSEPRGLLWVSDTVHVLAAATWAGGIAMLATVLWRRQRAHRAWDAAYLAVRFSVIAGAAVVLAGIAGIGLTIAIIDEPDQLWTTTWGRVLIAKVVLVAIVAAIGAYNHFRLIPLLERSVDLRTVQGSTSEEAAPGGQRPAPTGEVRTVATQTRQQTEMADEQISRRLWLTACAEAIFLLGVVGLTGWLINASAVG